MKFIRSITRMLLLVLLSAAAVSCNTGEGTGGTGAIEGTVYKVLHPDDNYNLEADTIIAAKEDVFLVYGTQGFYGDDAETDHTGLYRFDYLRPGTYTVYAYTEKGHVWATYIDKDGNILYQGWAYGQRMYIQRQGEDFPFDDVRAGIDGVFAFQKLTPGTYTVFTFNEDGDEIPSVVAKTIAVPEPDHIYAFPDTFRINIKP